METGIGYLVAVIAALAGIAALIWAITAPKYETAKTLALRYVLFGILEAVAVFMLIATRKGWLTAWLG